MKGENTMTVKNLIEMLQQYDGNTEVMIGKYQRYGSDFAYTIKGIEDDKILSGSFGDDREDVIFLLEGSQEGTMAEAEEFDDLDEEIEED